ALVGKAALDFVRQEEEILSDLAGLLRVPAGQVGERLKSLLDEVKTLKKQLAERRPATGARVSADDLLATAQQVAGATAVIQALENVTPEEMRQLVDVLRRKQETGLAV